MMDFQCLKPEYRDRLHDILFAAGRQSCEYSFANLYLWGRQQVCILRGWLAVFSHFRGRSVYMFPVGQGDPKLVLDAMIADAHSRGIPFRMVCLTRQETELLEKLYPGTFHFNPNRDSFDYIYEIDRLADLGGKKLQQKRNHVNRFLRENPEWHTEEITLDKLKECKNFTDAWYERRKLEDPQTDIKMEQIAMDRLYAHFEALKMEGIMLYAGEKLVAVTLGNGLNPDTWDVNFEKADPTVEGAYAVVNREYARYIRERHPEIRYLNREDDMGLPGLRKAKESYEPDILLEKYTAVLLSAYDGD